MLDILYPFASFLPLLIHWLVLKQQHGKAKYTADLLHARYVEEMCPIFRFLTVPGVLANLRSHNHTGCTDVETRFMKNKESKPSKFRGLGGHNYPTEESCGNELITISYSKNSTKTILFSEQATFWHSFSLLPETVTTR